MAFHEARMRPVWVVACAAAAMVVPGLAGCGGSGGTAGGGAASTAPATDGYGASGGAAGASGGSSAPGGSGGLTAPGSRLAFGQAATVGWVPPSADGQGAQKGYKLQVAVESIVKGSIGDFKHVQLDAAQQRSTPYYVTLRITSLGSTPPPGKQDPAISFDAIDDRGQQQTSVTFLGTFRRCNDNSVPASFASGKSYTSCLTYLMPGSGSILRMQWGDGPHAADQVTPYFDHPIVWGAS